MDDDDGTTTPPAVWLDPADIHILRFISRREPTYHINVAKELPQNIDVISRRCKDLARRGLLDRQSRTVYALTDEGEEFVAGTVGPTELVTDRGPD